MIKSTIFDKTPEYVDIQDGDTGIPGSTGIPVCEDGSTGIPVCEDGSTGIPACGDSSAGIPGSTGIPACGDQIKIDIHITHRNLPHWTKTGSIYWITFRLADSLPQEKLDIWKTERDYWKANHPAPWKDAEYKEYNKQFGERLESWLDSGYGSCVLARPKIRQIVQKCLLRFNSQRLKLHAGVIMPNHVHILLEPFTGFILSELLKGIKGASARQINRLLGKTGTPFWMDESYDHIVRNEDQFQYFLKYIIENPTKARLSQNQYWLYRGTGIPGSTGIPACGE